ncbi:MAG: hypothetical protein M3Y23_01875 [Actinomycetota bacterium]|nr:hypothetical protein [Actinomycetota bacterium]
MTPTARKFSKVLLTLMASAVLAFGLAACSGGSDGDETAREAPTAAEFPSADGKTIEEFYGEMPETTEMVVSPAALVYDVGENRVPFGVFDVGGEQVDDAEVALYFAKTTNSEVMGPLPAKVESLETKPAFRAKGSDGPGEATTFYVVDEVDFNRPGPWLAMAVIEGDDGPEVTRLPSPAVGQYPGIPSVGDKAPVVSTPTAESVGGDLAKIDTRQPPSSMHDSDFKDVVGKEPVLLQFATPALCQTRVCGPVVDITEQVKSEFGDQAEFIHSEVYVNNTPPKLRPPLNAFGLESEPWLFLVGKDGKIQRRVEGPFSVGELTTWVEELTGDGEPQA